MVDMMNPETRQWDILYSFLAKRLSEIGTESFTGDGDFWVVDDDWGDDSIKVCIFNIGILTKPLIEEVRQFIELNTPNWTVLFQVELGQTIPTNGIKVNREGYIEEWNRDLLSRLEKFNF